MSITIIGYSASNDRVFYTLEGSGPDKWASIWYLEKHIFYDGAVGLVSQNELDHLDPVKTFDVPNGKFQRTGNSTTLNFILDGYPPKNATSLLISNLIHQIEIDAWSGDISLEARIVEQGFRNMQLRYGRDTVGKACYMQFFDNVAEQLEENSLEKLDSPNDLIPGESCLPAVAEIEVKKPTKIDTKVPTLPLKEVLKLTSSNSKLLFLDTRETWEFEEGHIPGAINMKLREINSDSAKSLLKHDTVIAYCVKDFRGYEAARKLRALGVNAVIMTPHGMRGWIEAELPVAGSRGTAEAVAMSELERIADEASKAVIH